MTITGVGFFKGALLTLGDDLAQHDYFDRAPELELVRHLRNGIAHGNRIEIRNPTSLERHPAHTGIMLGQNIFNPEFIEIRPELHDTPVLFDFIGPLSLTRLLFGDSSRFGGDLGERWWVIGVWTRGIKRHGCRALESG